MNGVFHLGNGVDLEPPLDPDPDPEGNRLRLVVGLIIPLVGVILL